MGRDCIKRLVDASRGFDPDKEATLSEKEAKALLEDLKAAAIAATRKGEDYTDAMNAEIVSRKLQAKEQGMIQKRNAYINIAKSKELRTRIDDHIAAGLNVKEAMQSLLVGINKNVTEGRYSVDAKYKQLHGKYLGGLVQDLERADLLPMINQKVMQNQIEDELWELSLKDGKPGISGSDHARDAAAIIHKYNEAARLRQNRAGAAIEKLDGFTATQTHDRQKMRKAGYEEWRNKIIQHLDQDRTFDGANPEAFLKSTYDSLSTGISLKVGVDEGKLFEFKGPANLAKKISQKRVLHFKSAADARAYRLDFGSRDFMEGVLSGFNHAARNIAMMETFGTNPRAMFDKLLSDTKGKYRDNPGKIKSVLNDRAVQNFYNEVDGSTHMVESPTGAQIGATLRGLQSLAKLGGAVISSLSDIPGKAAELQFQGFGLLDSYGIGIGDIFRGIGHEEQKQLAHGMGIGLDGMMGHIASRFSANDDLPGTISKSMRLFFKLNGLTWWTDAQKVGTGLAMSTRLASFKHLGFEALDADTKRIFNNFGIKSEDWDLIRKTVAKEVDGNEYITADSIHNLPDEMFGTYARKKKEALEGKLQAYFIDRVDYATVSPGARENAILTQGLKRGTLEGEMFRLFSQFKSFPVSVLSKIYGRALYGKGKADIPALIQYVVMSTVFGYASMSLKDITKGREPRQPNDLKSLGNTMAAAFTQGGGAGILGDFMMGEYNRFGNDLTTTLAGPTFSTANDVAKLYSSMKDPESNDKTATAFKLLVNNAPFINLVYIRPALNYMFLYQMQESMNPGYLRRMERRVEKENNQKFLIKPSSVK